MGSSVCLPGLCQLMLVRTYDHTLKREWLFGSTLFGTDEFSSVPFLYMMIIKRGSILNPVDGLP